MFRNPSKMQPSGTTWSRQRSVFGTRCQGSVGALFIFFLSVRTDPSHVMLLTCLMACGFQTLARELVSSRRVISRLYENRAQLNSLSMHLGETVGKLRSQLILIDPQMGTGGFPICAPSDV